MGSLISIGVALACFIFGSQPTLFLGGLIEMFKCSVWTLIYREVRGLEAAEPEPGVV